MKQPMAGVVVCFALGIGIGNAIPSSPLGIALAAALASLAALVGFRHPSAWLAASLLLAGWANVTLHTASLSPVDLRETTPETDQLVTLHGTLEHTPRIRLQSFGDRWTSNAFAVLNVRWRTRPDPEQTHPVSGSVLVSGPATLGDGYHAGRRIVVTGVLRAPPRAQAPGLFDYRDYLAARGIHRELRAPSPDDWSLADPLDATQPPWSDRFQAWARTTLARGLPVEDDELRLLWAMSLGWKTALVDDVEESFLRSGTLHVFAISGLHVALIANVLVQALRLVLLPRFLAGVVALPVLWLYVAATGWQSSAVRSAIMSSVIIASWMCSRPVNLLNSLATAAFGVLAWNPCQLFQAGFQLSFAVVGAIGLLVPRFEERLRGWTAIDPFLPEDAIPAWRRYADAFTRRIGANLAVSVAAWVGSLPLSAWYFHLVTPSGLAANLLVVPLSSLALASCVASLACGHWLPSLGEYFNHAAWFWMHGMLVASRRCAELPFGCWQVASPPVSLVALAYVLVLALGIRAWACPRLRQLTLGATLALGAGAVAEWRLDAVETRIGVLALRGGHAVCVQTPQGVSVVDSGDAPGAKSVVHPYLRARGVNRIEDLWLSHGDVRHVGGSPELLSRYHPRRIGVGPVRFRSAPYREIVAQLQKHAADRLHTLADGDTLGPWRVLHPAPTDKVSQADDGSLVLQLGEGSDSVLVVGDLGRPGQEQLMRRHRELRAGVVISGIPVRGEPLCDGLLERLQPRMVIVTDALQPATARASTSCKRRLRARPWLTWFTSESGSLELRRTHGQWEIRDAQNRRLDRASPDPGPPQGNRPRPPPAPPAPRSQASAQFFTNPGSFPVTR